MPRLVRGITIALQSLFLFPIGTATWAADRDLALTITALPSPARVGEPLTYSLSIANNGKKMAKKIILVNPLPADTSLVSASRDCRIANNMAGTDARLICKTKRLAPGASLSWSFVVRPEATGELTNTAQVMLEKRDANPADNTFSLSTVILPDLASLMVESTTLPPGTAASMAEDDKTVPGSNSRPTEGAKASSGSKSHAPEDTKTSSGSHNHTVEGTKASTDSDSHAPEDTKTSSGTDSSTADPDKIAMPTMQANAKRDYKPVTHTGELETVATANTALAFDLYAVFRQDTTGNFVFSTSDIAQSLAMLAAGADGNTLAAVLGASRIDLPETHLHPAINAAALELTDRNRAARLKQNAALWGQGQSATHAQSQYLFASRFLDTLAEHYGPKMTPVDFTDPAAEASIIGNAIAPWLAANTHGKIRSLVDVLPERTRLASASAISLNGAWQVPPDANVAATGRFELLDDTQVLAPMMSFSGQFAYAEGDGYRAFELPLAGSDLALTVLMPEHGRFAEFQAAFNLDRLNDILAAMTPRQITLHLPKIAISNQGTLTGGILALLEQSAAFSEGQADFSRVNGEGYLFLEHPVRGTVVSLGKDGAKADGTTLVVHRATKDEPNQVWSGAGLFGSMGSLGSFISMGSFCAPIPHYDPALALARPFLFTIRDRITGSILFMGQLTKPAGNPAPPDWTTDPCQLNTITIQGNTVGGVLNR